MTTSHHSRKRPIGAVTVTVVALAASTFAFASSTGVQGADPDDLAPTVDPNAPELAIAEVRGSDEIVMYDVIGEMAITDGDIILGTHADVQENGIAPLAVDPEPTCNEGQQCGVIQTGERQEWPNGVVPYTLAPGTSGTAAANVRAAIGEWENKTSIRFVERSNERDYVEFVGTGNGNTCSSYLGRIGGRQAVNYAGEGRGCLVHEIGHAVGLHHEQNRNDRDDYINIDFSNISGNAASQFQIATRATDVGVYDFGSVMHYSPFSFALDRSRPVITPKDPSIPLSVVGSRGTLTVSDVQAVEFVYAGTPPPPPTTTTTTTVPPTTSTTTTTTVPPTTTTTTTVPPTTSTTTTTTVPPTTTTTTTTVPPTTTAPPITTAPPTTTPPTTAPPTTAPPTTTPPTTAPPTTAPPTTAPPTGNRDAVVTFETLTDGGTIPARTSYGDILVGAFDPDAGTSDGDGIRSVTLVASNPHTGRRIGARTEYRTLYEYGARLRPGTTYTFTAYARSSRSAGGGWTATSVTVTAV